MQRNQRRVGYNTYFCFKVQHGTPVKINTKLNMIVTEMKCVECCTILKI